MLHKMYPIAFVFVTKICIEGQKDHFHYWDSAIPYPPIHKTDNRKETHNHQKHLAIAARVDTPASDTTTTIRSSQGCVSM